MRIAARLQAKVILAVLLPVPAAGHVKWFAPYDVSQPPLPLGGVLGAHFLLVFAGFLLLVFGGYVLDRAVARSGYGLARSGRAEALEERLMRAGIGSFFVALFATGGVILTPELRSDAEWPAWLQGAIALSMLSARTTLLGALGILVLYGHAVAEYGVFHLTDYPIFLGIAAYLALTSLDAPRLRALRVPILTVTFCASLMWGAVEKWAYPQWTFPLLAEKPYLTFGIPAADFMVIAGFVEFALAFHILTGLGLLRLGTAGLGLIFVAAIIDFGRLDAIGHLPVIVPLAVLFLHGPTPLHRRLHDARRGLLSEARRAGLGFAAAIALFMGAYWGLQHAEYGSARPRAAMTAMAGR
ncbi:hypothetical protein GCM10011504_20010 [Siccirubricoccus deserti]|uniref:DoxX family membrane protein n=1 Tax=Siccirubricoccus deserti TaxID=2013562 RepID=A0A9X0QWX5_9PROT|nr:hypothetical protein [Siccirubricoccus deserti]MBC4015426.1 hypothetical protein [Siccirubricoccus deserti]GGC41559.1 hypothetical protein GCM10011504_20010 [Siccirubricoccus deserti]